MKEDNISLLLVASRVLTYPSKTFFEEKEMVMDCVNEDIENDILTQSLNDAIRPLYELSLTQLEKFYVATFDFKSSHGLYLTAHELGDSTKRGVALIKLQNIIKENGFEQDENELSDYIPMLFEFLAVAPENGVTDRLIRRLAVVLQRILGHLPEDNLYYSILGILMTHIFPEPTTKEIEKIEFEREEADLEELPFPIMYN